MEKLIISGFGGQGVLSLGQIIAYAAMGEGLEVTWLPSYGPEMRGGTANCSVVIDKTTVASPVIAVPDTLIAMNKPSLTKFESKVRSGGKILINSSLISEKPSRSDIEAYCIPANDIAHSAGNDKAASLVMMGAYLALSGFLSYDAAKAAISKYFSAKPAFIASNLAAFEAGYNLFSDK
ncbi:MAG TPA: 2-oxoacid:acceptor oxidoreductase family protein [Eubacteriales bacterium]|jgi:2-oxoglutarate ferredoxin oxidoreductase subunit gamma|nr:2-oxoacid:acceptor oxidoreductase family protein [Clostridia bacterium]HRR90000.1 2-oxoacid:acceptor oxidoreductase family protein [Eubacteriales bacterium]HRU84959.1 2-oxoacid:acceptor oxidoreductase family protein [Eubacteriales bacterium]